MIHLLPVTQPLLPLNLISPSARVTHSPPVSEEQACVHAACGTQNLHSYWLPGRRDTGSNEGRRCDISNPPSSSISPQGPRLTSQTHAGLLANAAYTGVRRASPEPHPPCWQGESHLAAAWPARPPHPVRARGGTRRHVSASRGWTPGSSMTGHTWASESSWEMKLDHVHFPSTLEAL